MDQINATQLVGLLSFGLTSALCYKAWRLTRDRLSAWGWLALVQALMTLDILFNIRHQVSNTIRSSFKSIDLYQDRRFLQAIILILFLSLAVLITVRFFHLRTRASITARLAIYTTFFALLVFGVEIISLHKVDRFLYHEYGHVKLIGWLWSGFSAATAILAIASIWAASAKCSGPESG